jgi:cell division protein FtsN
MKVLKRYGILGLAVVVVMMITVAACSKGEQEESGAAEEMSGTMGAAKDYVNEQRKEAVEALRTAYDGFTKKFEEFQQRNAYVFTEEKRNIVNNIEEKMTQVEQQLMQARSATEETWEQIKADVTATMEELEQAMIDFES